MDTVTPEKRSEIMRSIKSRNTGPERKVAAALRLAGITGWRRYRRVCGIEVDFAWPRQRVALFVQGCFWHAHQPCFRLPKTRRAWWRTKIGRNVARDRRQRYTLVNEGGWRVLKVWECQLHRVDPKEAALKLIALLRPRRSA